ncbi:helicase-related protein [Pseudactinotalea sp. Z1748]|uniref:helicase-related protein n=1 Tax=Pseudactinotalea sp. Z1748 TaxID=3413027 RepID=UPI003C7AC236
MSAPIAFLTGTYRQPVLRLVFGRRDRTRFGQSMIDWVKALPGRRWNPEERAWDVTGVGTDPQRTLKRAGFAIDYQRLNDDESLQDITDLSELVDPLLKLSSRRPGIVLVRHRLVGFDIAKERLGPGAVWDSATSRFEVTVADMLDAEGQPKSGLIMSKSIIAAARRARGRTVSVARVGKLALSASVEGAGKVGRRAIEKVGDVPQWFGADDGLELFPYQRSGAIAMAAGNRLISDLPGLGKTLSSLAALAITGTRRFLIISPPVAMTHWQREVERSGILAHLTDTTEKKHCHATSRSRRSLSSAPQAGDIGEVVTISPRRKVPDLPEKGAVVISDSLIASRPALAADLLAWGPDALIVDEVHRHKTWGSVRATAVRELAQQVPGLRIAISGTPMFAQPAELASPLAITGQLDPIFGGHGQFLETYTRPTPFHTRVARAKMMPQLREVFDDQVWVRRRKEAVVDLPPIMRHDVLVDVDLRGFRAAHKEVTAKVAQWVDEIVAATGEFPRPKEVESFARAEIGLSSILRRAAGLAKVEAATEWITSWIQANPATPDEHGQPRYDRPLVVWTHHREVSEAMARAVPQAVGGARIIIGGTRQDERNRIVDDFQAGKVPVLVGSITAAGVGITLTRSSDALFVETDWTPAQVQQAEQRVHRLGSTRSAILRTMVAPGTMDERVQQVLADKGRLLEPLMGEGQDVSVVEFEDEQSMAPAQIIADIAQGIIARRQRSTGRRAA